MSVRNLVVVNIIVLVLVNIFVLIRRCVTNAPVTRVMHCRTTCTRVGISTNARLFSRALISVQTALVVLVARVHKDMCWDWTKGAVKQTHYVSVYGPIK